MYYFITLLSQGKPDHSHYYYYVICFSLGRQFIPNWEEPLSFILSSPISRVIFPPHPAMLSLPSSAMGLVTPAIRRLGSLVSEQVRGHMLLIRQACLQVLGRNESHTF